MPPPAGFEPGSVSEVDVHLLNAVLTLKHRRPQLALRHVNYDSPGFEEELMESEEIPLEPAPFGGW